MCALRGTRKRHTIACSDPATGGLSGDFHQLLPLW